MNTHSMTWGGLDCWSIDCLPEGHEPRLLVVLCHGFGAPAEDLLPLASELIGLNADLEGQVRFIFPAAPLLLDSLGVHGGRAWWYLDLERRMAAIQRGELSSLRNDVPKGLAAARERLMALVEELRDETGLPTSRIVLGGFSQGSMLATDTALHLPERPAGLCIWSGTLLAEDTWRELAARRGSLPVVQSHGFDDPILPFQAAEWLRDLLHGAGMTVEFVPFSGGHTIPFEALERFARMLGRLVT